MSDKKTVELSALDRADLRDVLLKSAEAFQEAADDCQPHVTMLKAHLQGRAERFRQLAILFAVLLCGCAEEHERIEGPPLYVHLCNEMSAADAYAWGKAAGDINLELGEYALWVGHGPPSGCSTVDVCPGSANTVTSGECTLLVRYEAGDADEVAWTGLMAALELVR